MLQLNYLKISPLIWDIWIKAWDMHLNGFHENILEIKDIKKDAPIAKQILEITENYLKMKNHLKSFYPTYKEFKLRISKELRHYKKFGIIEF